MIGCTKSPMPARRTALVLPRVAWGTILLFLGTALLWGAALTGGATGRMPGPLAMALASAAAWAAFTVMHDASHDAVARCGWLNDLAGHVSATILMSRFCAFRQIHRLHHRHTNDPELDPDHWSGSGARWQLPLRWATADLNYYFEYRRCPPLPLRQELAAWGTLVLLLVAASAAIYFGFGRALLFYWIVPARFALFVLTYVFDFVPHQRPYGRPATEDRFAASFIIPGAAITRLLLCQNLHLLHHLYPAVPFYRLPRIWRERRQELVARGAARCHCSRCRPLCDLPGSRPRCQPLIRINNRSVRVIPLPGPKVVLSRAW